MHKFQNLKSSRNEKSNIIHESSTEIKSNSLEPFAKMISRDKLEELEKKQINNNKFGIYNPKYNFVFNKSSLYEDKDALEVMKKKNDLKYMEYRK